LQVFTQNNNNSSMNKA